MQRLHIGSAAQMTDVARYAGLLLLLSAALAGFFLLLEIVVSLVDAGPRDLLAVSPSEEKTFGVPNGVDLIEALVLGVSVVLAAAVLVASLGWPLRRTALRASWPLAAGTLGAAAIAGAGAYLSLSGMLGSAIVYDEHMVQRIYLESGSLILLGAFFLTVTIAGILHWRLLAASLLIWLAAAGAFGFLDTEPIDGLLLFPRTYLLETPAGFAAAVRGLQQSGQGSSGQGGSQQGAALGGSAAGSPLLTETMAEQLPQVGDAPLFQVTGAVHTLYLRSATGETYSDGAWSPPSRESVTLDGSVSVRDALEPLADRLHLPTTPPFFEFANVIEVTPAEGADSLPRGPLPSAKNLQRVDTPTTYFPFSETLASDSRLPRYQMESVIRVMMLRDKVEAAPVSDEAYLQLPDTLPPGVRELAAEVGNATSPYLNARLLQTYLQETYVYSPADAADLPPPPDGRDPVDWFLFDSGVGGSGNFSSAFVALARAAGIPARPVSGWLITPQEETQTVRQGQAHQWAEIALDGLGWMPIDPTPGDAFGEADVAHGFEAALNDLTTSAAAEAQEAAAAVLGEQDSAEALLLLFEAIDGIEVEESRSAAQATMSALTLDHIIDLLLTSDDPQMRAAAAYGLGVLEDPRALDALLQALAEDEDAEVRAAAAGALGVLGKDGAEEALLQALDSDEAALVRAAAARALGALKSEGTAEQMIPALRSDPIPEVRAAVALALGEIRDNVALPSLLAARANEEAVDVREAADEALAQWRFDALREALETEEDPALRAAAAELLGERGDLRAIGVLGNALGDLDASVREVALDALGQLGEITQLENGSSLLRRANGVAFIPGLSAENIASPARSQVFRVAGAEDTGLLRVAVGDIYADGVWLPAEQEGIPVEQSVEYRPTDIRPAADVSPQALNRITLFPADPARRILPGRLPTSLYPEEFSFPVTYWLPSHTVTTEALPNDYSWSANVYDYSRGRLNAAATHSSAAAYTQLPDGAWIERVRDLARQITAGHTSPYFKAKAIEAYLRAEYRYRTTSGLPIRVLYPNQDPVEAFLFSKREGTSTGFSSAFVMLARSIGIPARAVSGWVVEETPEVQVVYTDQAHQWAEIPFEGLGWVAFDPAPRSAQDASDGSDEEGVDPEEPPDVTPDEDDEDDGGADDALDALERQGADVTRLESGAALVGFGDAPFFFVGTTTAQATKPPEFPVFQVRGAANTGYLRLSAGDVYEDGAWLQLDPLRFPYTAGSSIPRMVSDAYASPQGTFATLPRERWESSALFGLRDAPRRVVADSIHLLPAGTFRALPIGVLPSSPDALLTSLDGNWYPFSATFSSDSEVAEYSWTSDVSSFSQRQYEAASAVTDGVYTQLPPGLPARIRQLAEEVTRPYSSPYAKARALERYLKTQYTYAFADTPADGLPPAGRDPVDWFLFDEREGTCGVFSSAFVVLARSVGIPARVVSGWVVSQMSGTQTVTTAQAHQWAEIALDGIGWVGFEPTGGDAAPSRVQGDTPDVRAIDDNGDQEPGLIPTETNITRWPTEIRRRTPFTVGGTVHAAGGQDVSGMTVEIYINETKDHGGTLIGTTTVRSGRFDAEALLPSGIDLGNYQLLARAVWNDRFAESWSDPDIKVVSRNRIELSGPEEVPLHERVVFRGRVLEDNGTGAAGRTVLLTVAGARSTAVVTDAEGGFTYSGSFSRLGPHSVEAELTGDEFLMDDNSVRLDFLVVLPTVFTLDVPAFAEIGEPVQITGQLRGSDDRLLSGKTLEVQFQSRPSHQVRTDAAGKFEAADVFAETGSYAISVGFEREGNVLGAKASVQVMVRHAVAMTIDGPLWVEEGADATFTGRLTSDTFSPMGQVEVTVEGAENSLSAVVDTDGGGRFAYRHPSFDSTGPHTFTARFAADASVAPASAALAFEVGAPTVLALDGPPVVRDGERFRVAGTLRDRDGAPIPNAAVQVTSGEPLTLTTDADGRFAWDVQAAFDADSARHPHESALDVEAAFRGAKHLAPSEASLDVAVGLPRIVAEPPAPASRGGDAALRGTVLLGTHPAPGVALAVGSGPAFTSNDVGAFTHAHPVPSDEALGPAELVITAPALGVSATVPLLVKSAANLVVTPVSGVRPGRTATLRAALLDDRGAGVAGATLRSSQGVDAVTDESGMAVLDLAVPEDKSLQGAHVVFTYDGDDLHAPLSVSYFWEGAITPSGFNWLLWGAAPLVVALAAATAYAGRRVRLPLPPLPRGRRSPAEHAPRPRTDAGSGDVAGADSAQRVQLRIAFRKEAPDLADVWGIGEEVHITVSMTDHEEIPITGAIVSVAVDDGAPPRIAVVGDDGVHAFDWRGVEPGEYPVSAEFGGDYDYLPAFASRSLRVVDFREEIVHLYDLFLDWAKERADEITEHSTPREVEAILVSRGLPIPQKALDELISRFEEADYSEHPITRRRYEAMYRAWSAVVEGAR